MTACEWEKVENDYAVQKVDGSAKLVKEASYKNEREEYLFHYKSAQYFLSVTREFQGGVIFLISKQETEQIIKNANRRFQVDNNPIIVMQDFYDAIIVIEEKRFVPGQKVKVKFIP